MLTRFKIAHRVVGLEILPHSDGYSAAVAGRAGQIRINDSAAMVLALMDGCTTLEGIAQHLLNCYPEAGQTIRDDFEPLVESLLDAGLVELASCALYEKTHSATTPPGILFLSGHGDATMEIARLCQLADVPLWLPHPSIAEQLPHKVSRIQLKQASAYGAREVDSLDGIRRRIEVGEIGVVLLPAAGGAMRVRQHLGDVPLAVRPGVTVGNSLEQYGIYSFMSPSDRNLHETARPNQWRLVKCIDFERVEKLLGRARRSAAERRGYYSYINRYESRFEESFARYQALVNRVPSLDLRHYGSESPFGTRPAYDGLAESRATIHIKSKAVCCNAVTQSISAGVPVIIDADSHRRLGLERYVEHGRSGMIFDDIAEGAAILERLDADDDLLDALRASTIELARDRCQPKPHELQEFRRFLSRANIPAGIFSSATQR